MRRGKKLLWQLYPSYMLVILVSMAAITAYATSSMKSLYIEQRTETLENKAHLINHVLSDYFLREEWGKIDALCKQMGKLTSSRYSVILKDGRVVGDSDKDPATMDDHSKRPEVLEAIATRKKGMAIRYSHSVKKDMMYVAVPIIFENKIHGFYRVSISLASVNQSIIEIYKQIAVGGLLVIFVAAFMSFLIAQRINRPLQELKEGALKFASGDLKYRFHVSSYEEISLLAESMNDMASQLDERLRTVTRQKNELESILSSLVEAVIVINEEEEILRINKAACKLFNIDFNSARGKSLQEAIRNPDILRFAQRTLTNWDSIEEEIVLHGEIQRFLDAHGTLLKDAKGGTIGGIIVLHDLTRVRKLEQIRKDFVANVSHELRTPITSIKGFVETLRDGAINDPDTTKTFLNIIDKHSDRLNAIIEDLLSLSRLERDKDETQITLSIGHIKPVLNSAILVCSNKAAEKRIEVSLSCPENIKAKINDALIEQAIVNLIDNAIKYSEPGSKVSIECLSNGEEAIIKVADNGCGIDPEHQSRIFERFYRVDKARSRKVGGTGLGLSIVKHIVQAHNGSVSVESSLGKGSVFTVRLPS